MNEVMHNCCTGCTYLPRRTPHTESGLHVVSGGGGKGESVGITDGAWQDGLYKSSTR
jgi:hypothetical protein